MFHDLVGKSVETFTRHAIMYERYYEMMNRQRLFTTVVAVVVSIGFVGSSAFAATMYDPKISSGLSHRTEKPASTASTHVRGTKSTRPGGLCKPAGADHLAYSTNLDSNYNSVSVVDTDKNKVVRYIPGFHVPANATPVADGSKLYVDNWYAPQANTQVVNPCTGEVVKTFKRPGGLFPLTNLSPDGRYLYLGTIQGFTIEKIDTYTDKVVRKYSMLQPGAGEPIGYAVPDPDGKTMWVAGLHHIYSLDLQSGKVTGSPIPAGVSPEWLAITPDGKRLLATNFVNGTDTVIDTKSRKVVNTVNVGLTSYPNSVSATPDSSQFWAGNLDGTVTVVDAKTGKKIRTINAGKMMTLDVTFSKDGKRAYVPAVPHSSKAVNLNGAATAFGLMVTGLFHAGPGEIGVYDTKTGKKVDSIKTGGLPSPLIAPTGPFN